jgi:poly(hydroxyalkanoate) depolymerase family esterase
MRTLMRAALALALGAGGSACASARRADPTAMQSERGTFASADGSRAYLLARPSGGTAAGKRAMVVVLHGCVQSADDIARGSRMTEAAAREGFVVLYPEQPASANVQRCWNWYLPAQTTRGAGEVALLAAMVDSIGRREGVDARRVAVVGMSAGAAMAANLVVAYPERFAALAMHSGIAAGAASDIGSALAVMAKGPADGNALGDAALAAMGPRARAIPVIAIHGAADKVVSPANLSAVVTQWTRVNARATGSGAPVEQHLLDGLGHAWSGGSPDVGYTAPQGPDATGMIVEFLRRAGVIGG